METKTCKLCGRTLPVSDFSKSYKGLCKECVAKLTRERRKATSQVTTSNSTKFIDWEQRRYEIAKDMLCAIYMDDGNESRCANHNMGFEYQSLESSAHTAVRYADALINELKKHDNG